MFEGIAGVSNAAEMMNVEDWLSTVLVKRECSVVCRKTFEGPRYFEIFEYQI